MGDLTLARLLFPLLLSIALASQLAFAQQKWNAGNYPNPMINFKQCGMKMSSLICDPDGVLSESDRYRLNHELQPLETRTRQDRAPSFCEKKGVTALMAVARRVQDGNQQTVKDMANRMLKSWSIDPQCQKAVVFVLSVEDKKFWIARDDATPVYDNELQEIFQQSKSLLGSGQVSQGLQNIMRGIWEKAVSKQSQSNHPSGGGGKQKPFQPQPQPPFSGGGGKDKSSGGGGSSIFSSLGLKFWLILFLIVLPILLCCCCIYCCCCRGRGGGDRSQVPTDPGYAEGGGRRAGGGGGSMFNNILGSFGGAGIGSMLGNFLSNRNRGGGGGEMGGMGGGSYPMGGSGGGSNYDYQGGGAYPAGPQPGYGDNSGQGGGLYPSAKIKSEGAGGDF
ncbi:hypothetical protein WR25_00826 [Diploscapter pachys]|uniref:TPM domain-containing protein n=1 Tax=Diploscapter pachys TaxID=2018661 RepID=A0A2A2JV44_9BILA|nr:hypothetical protein WR25_00826 [Diploscapter pachys]